VEHLADEALTTASYDELQEAINDYLEDST